MNKYDQQIMVVKKETLFNGQPFQGFKPAKAENYEARILKHLEYKRRGDMEESPEYKQPISYCLIVNPQAKTVFAYQRSLNTGDYSEKRLRGKWSIGVGGHIDKIEAAGNPIHTSLLREIEEEIHLPPPVVPKVLGYINDDTTEVGKVHFGILYLIETSADEVAPRDAEIAFGKLKTLEQLDFILKAPNASVEEWSQIALQPLYDYFKVQTLRTA